MKFGMAVCASLFSLPCFPQIITTVAGNGKTGFSCDEVPTANASFSPRSLAMDAAGNVVGNGRQGFSGDGGPAMSASLNHPIGLALDSLGNLYIADTLNSRIRKADTNGVITTVAGNGHAGFSGDRGSAASASLHTVLP